MTRRRGELQLQILGALFEGERGVGDILDHIGEPVEGRRKCEVVLDRLRNDGLVARSNGTWKLTLQGRGYVRQLREVLGGCE